MAEIKPFRAILYNKYRLGGLEMVTAPPYDVISPELQHDLYSRHPKNVVRLILGKSLCDDSPANDKYTRARYNFSKWMEESALIRDTTPSIYYYTQTYRSVDGAELTRKGFIALSKLEELGTGKIHAHEQTFAGPKADRLKLMEACQANFSCIFSLYSEPGFTINRKLDAVTRDVEPTFEVVDDENILNRVWSIDDPAVIESVVRTMEGKDLFIADGHHRYESALNYRRLMVERAKGSTGKEPFNYVMMYFSNMEDEGMTIGPTHRIIHSIEPFENEAFLKECRKYFDIKELPYNADNEPEVRGRLLAALQSAGDGLSAFGMRLQGTQVYYILTLKSTETMDAVFGDSIAGVFKNLDVIVLHELILSKILGITREAQERQENIIYVKSSEDAVTAMQGETNQIVFFLNPTRIEQVKAVAEAGLVMPQKSTFFYPKLLTGLVMNLLSD